MVRAICEPDGFVSRTREMVPNQASQRTALRAVAERVRDRIVAPTFASGIRAVADRAVGGKIAATPRGGRSPTVLFPVRRAARWCAVTQQ